MFKALKKSKEFTFSFIKNPLFSGSFVMIVGSNFANAIAYLYHLIVGRLLGPNNYGELSAILSVLGLLFTAFNFLGLVIVKFVSSAKKHETPYIFGWFLKRSYVIAIAMGILLLIANPLIGSFLHLQGSLTILIAPIVAFAFLTFVYRSFAQGLLKFWSVVVSTNLDLLTRLLVGLFLIYLGYAVFGAVVGIFAAMLVSFSYLQQNLRNQFSRTNEVAAGFGGKVFKYSAPLLVSTITTNSMIMTDVILAKHFFDPLNAGIYASLSTLGKIIFYGTGPISAVMFPLIAKKFSEKKNYNGVFAISFLLTLAICFWILLLYYFFPDHAVKILFGDKYLGGSPYLFAFGIFISLFALSSIIYNFFLSIEKTKVVYFSIVASVLQIVGFCLWHDNILQVIMISIYVTLAFLLTLVVYYLYHFKYEKIQTRN